ncbi:MAG: MBL fold metallo-hydrolase [Cyclobacteriaceae bacterium]|nr:MBL fold metallo-hydrolase [Cyclobacteriaceae bacterium]
MLQIKVFTFNAFQENTYVLFDQTREAVIIDPGCYEPDEQNALHGFIETEKLKPTLLLNTHCHVDHVLGNDFVKTKYKIPLLIHEKELPVLKSVRVYAPAYGFARYHETQPDNFLSEGNQITFGVTHLKILFLPGHAPGHVGFYNEATHSLLSGDVLFDGSIGRTDLPGGDFNTLLQSIRQKVFLLPDETTVYPGHGETTTVGKEKVTNPFCAVTL